MEFQKYYESIFILLNLNEYLYESVKENYKCLLNLNIIDANNKDIYNKTYYLLNNFIYNGYSSDDTHKIFEEIIKLNISVHYLPQNKDISNILK